MSAVAPMPRKAYDVPAGFEAALEAAGGAVSPFRRSHVAPKRKKRSPFARLASRAAFPTLLAALPVAAALWLLHSPRFAFSELALTPNPRVSASWVEEALRPFSGENLLALSLAGVTLRLSQHPWVKSVELKKMLPQKLLVTLTTREAAAVLERGGTPFWAEAGGQLISPLAPGESAAALPRIREHAPAIARNALSATQTTSVPKALAVLAEVARAQPSWRRELEVLEVLGGDDFRLNTKALPFPVLLSSTEPAARCRQLARLLPEVEGRYARLEHADLRFSRRIVLVPATFSDSTPRASEIRDAQHP